MRGCELQGSYRGVTLSVTVSFGVAGSTLLGPVVSVSRLRWCGAGGEGYEGGEGGEDCEGYEGYEGFYLMAVPKPDAGRGDALVLEGDARGLEAASAVRLVMGAAGAEIVRRDGEPGRGGRDVRVGGRVSVGGVVRGRNLA